MNWYKFLFFSAILMLNSCSEPETTPPPSQLSKKQLLDNNKKSVRVERAQIEGFIKRRGWKMTATGTGLQYMIYDSTVTQNRYPKDRDIAHVAYEVKLINGRKIYESTANEPATFIIGKDDVESGLQEGIMFMKPGNKAKMIMPAHLAHGFTGDFNKIPRNSTVIFDITLIDLK